jgi:SAM-dependent methyltransferase
LIDASGAAVDVLARAAPEVVDLGTGSGALAARVLRVRPRARVIGIDEDPAMLTLALKSLRGRLSTVHASFERAPLPPCDLITASYALHHVRTRRRKAALYGRAFAALRRGGVFLSGDNFLASSRAMQAADRAAWIAHLRRRYDAARAEAFLRTWAKEDVYFTLRDELSMLEAAGFAVDVAWRRDSFAVICGIRR